MKTNLQKLNDMVNYLFDDSDYEVDVVGDKVRTLTTIRLNEMLTALIEDDNDNDEDVSPELMATIREKIKSYDGYNENGGSTK